MLRIAKIYQNQGFAPVEFSVVRLGREPRIWCLWRKLPAQPAADVTSQMTAGQVLAHGKELGAAYSLVDLCVDGDAPKTQYAAIWHKLTGGPRRVHELDLSAERSSRERKSWRGRACVPKCCASFEA
jgi:hypothetical protein